MVGARVKEVFEREAKERMGEGGKNKGKENLPYPDKGQARDKAVKAALKHPNGAKMSDAKIAEHVGVSDRMVANYRAEMTPKVSESPERTGRDGRTINTQNIGTHRVGPH